MDGAMPKLKNAPIVEAVLEIVCDMPPDLDIAALQERAQEAFRPQYPKVRTVLMREHHIETKALTQSRYGVKHRVQGVQLVQDDEKQLVQVKTGGFSFHRLAPYSTLDDYLGEMERTWRLFVQLSSPVQVRLVQLRSINRLLLPMSSGQLALDEYLKTCSRLPDEDRFGLLGFLNQHEAVEKETGNRMNIVMASQLLDQG
jgi:uncharacterized protein (TIGR04255 family)